MTRALLVAVAALALAGCGGDDDGRRGDGDGGPGTDGGTCEDGVPRLVCSDVRTACTGARTAADIPPPTVDESCGALIGTVTSDAPAAGFPVGDTVVHFEGSGESGSGSCVSTVTVTDETPPVVDCPTEGITLVRTAPDPVAPPPPAATDGCDDEVDVSAEPTSLDRGTTPVTFTAVDDAGLEGTCTTDVTVLDAFAPSGFRIISARLRGDGRTDVTLAWDASPGADTTGYAVERAPAADGPWTRLETLGAGARTWTDRTLADDRAHYRVVAMADGLDGGATDPLLAHSIAATGYDLRNRPVPTVPFLTTLYGVVRHPRELSAGPHPLVVMLHGNHGNCRRTFTSDGDVCGDSRDHECPFSGWVTTPNAEGMAYLAETLAAQGYVAVSISGNALNCREDYILERAHLIITHLRRWLAWNTIGGAPFGDTFVGAIDLRHVALVGHSRGGEAVAHVPGLLRSDPIRGVQVVSVFSIAPTDYHDPQVVDVPYAVLLPGCDADVWTLEGMDIYDRSLVSGDGRAQSQVLFARANHNYFNTEWRRDDNGDGRVCPTSIEVGAPAQRGMLEGVLGSWIRATAGGAGFEPFVRAEGRVPEGIDAWADTALDLRWAHAAADRVPIDDFSSASAPATNLLGESNTFSSDFYVARACFANGCESRFEHDEHALLLSWDGTGMPVARFGLGGLDGTGHGYLSFRVASRRSTFNSGRDIQDFWLRVMDGAGGSSELLVSEVQRIPHLYPANAPLEVLSTVRVPLERFAADGVDTGALERIEIEVPAPDRDTGSFLITDIELAD